VWFEHGEEWIASCNKLQKSTLKAKVRPRQSVHWVSQCCFDFDSNSEEFHYLTSYPWHSFGNRFALYGMPVCEIVCYTIRHKPTQSMPYFVAELEGLPHIKVQATTKEELERKVIERFQMFIEGLSEFEVPQLPLPKVEPPPFWPFIATPQSRRPPPPWFDNGLLLGVDFVF
jgi:hypothetical protein